MKKIEVGFPKKCLECKKVFIPMASKGRPRGKDSKRWSSTRFCSKSCSATFTNRGTKKTLGKHWKVKDTSKMKHNRYPYWMIGRKPSEETRKRLSESHKGEKAYQWKGGVSKKYKTGYYSVDYRLWRERIFARDRYLCQNCGGTGYITAHHIKSFNKYPELRFDLDNGVTLCQPCHKQIDNYKGREGRLQ